MLSSKLFLMGLLAGVTLMSAAAKADVFVTNWTSGTVGEYTNSGGTVNASLIGGLSNPAPIVVTGNNVLVVNFTSGNVGQYVLSSPGVLSSSSPSLITGLVQPRGIAASGSTFYVSSFTGTNGVVGKYTLGVTPGTLASSTPSFITGLTGGPNGVVLSGSRLFIENTTSGVIGEYDANSGAAVNASLLTVPNSQGIALFGSDMYITSFSGSSFTVGKYTLGATPGTLGASVPSLLTGSGGPMAIGVNGTDLYLTSFAGNVVGRYTTSGATVNASLITGLGGSVGLAVTPEPATLALLGIGAAGLLVRRRSGRRQTE